MTTTAAPLRGYQASIAAATGVTDPAKIDEIEEVMRAEYRALDHLAKRQFDGAARRAHDYLTALAQAAVPRKVDDLVGCSRRPGVTYKIKHINGASYRLTNLATGQELRASKSLVTDPPAQATATADPAAAEYRAIVESLNDAEAAHMPMGTLARWNGPKAAAGVEIGGLCVILGSTAGDTYRAAKLGGCPGPSGDRYITKARRSYFQVVDPSTLTA
jgi:hypothetical protein